MDSKNSEINFSRPLKSSRTRWAFIWGLNAILKNAHFFLNSNKTPKNSEIKSYLILLLNPQYFFILGKSFYSLSHIFVIEIIDDKINKIKWSYSQNLRELKYENIEIPNSLHGSLSCVEFLGSTKMQIKYDMQRWSSV